MSVVVSSSTKSVGPFWRKNNFDAVEPFVNHWATIYPKSGIMKAKSVVITGFYASGATAAGAKNAEKSLKRNEHCLAVGAKDRIVY